MQESGSLLQQLSHRLRRAIPAPLRRRLRNMLKRRPDSASLEVAKLARSAQLASQQKAWNLAVDRWSRLLAQSAGRETSRAFVGLAEAYRRLDKLDEAEAFARAGLALEPSSRRLAIEVAELASARKNWAEARGLWGDILERDGLEGAWPRVFTRLAGALRATGDLEAAREIIEQGKSQHPTSRGIANESAEIAYSCGNWDQAIAEFEALLFAQDGDKRRRILGRLARAHLNAGYLESGGLLIKRGLEEWPEDPTLMYLLATSSSMNKSWREAVDNWSGFLDMNAGAAARFRRVAETKLDISLACRDRASQESLARSLGATEVSTSEIARRQDRRPKALRTHKVSLPGRSHTLTVLEKICAKSRTNLRERLVNETLVRDLRENQVSVPDFLTWSTHRTSLSLYFEFIDDAHAGDLPDEFLPSLIEQLRRLSNVKPNGEALSHLQAFDLVGRPATRIHEIQRTIAHAWDDLQSRESLLRGVAGLSRKGRTENLEAAEAMVRASAEIQGFFERSEATTCLGLTHFDLHPSNAVVQPTTGRIFVVDLAYMSVAPYGFDLAILAVTREASLAAFESDYIQPFFESGHMADVRAEITGNLFFFYALAALYVRPDWAARNLEDSVLPAVEKFRELASDLS